MKLPEDHRAVQDAVRAYVQAEITPHAAEWDRDRAGLPRTEVDFLPGNSGTCAFGSIQITR